MNNRPSALQRPSSGAGKRRLKDLLAQPGNRACADCGTPDPKWASSNIGVFICLKCSGVHRSLGTHISKVLSVTLDEWSDDQVDSMVEVGGNASANSIYEAYLPQGVSKPGPGAGPEERSQYIRCKYELQEFLKPSLRILSTSSKHSLQASMSAKITDSFRSSASSQQSEGMVEFIGMLKVQVLNGTNLAVRDMLSSDPYVVLKLGKQQLNLLDPYNMLSVESANSCGEEQLEPRVERGTYALRSTKIRPHKAGNPHFLSSLHCVLHYMFLIFSIRTKIPHTNVSDQCVDYPSCVDKLQEVYDYDTFSADDIMGEAEIDIQSMITSATAFGDVGMFDNMQIGRWLKSHDNALLEDSTVNIVDGKVKQSVSLKLQNVESGEMHLELEWIPLDQ